MNANNLLVDQTLPSFRPMLLSLVKLSQALMNLDMAKGSSRPNRSVTFFYDFTQSIFEQFEKGRKLSDKQLACLDRLGAQFAG